MSALGLWNLILPKVQEDSKGGKPVEHTMKWETIKDELFRLDLSANEVDIYMLLARSGSKKAGELSRYLSIPKTETYVTLTSLQNKGMVREIPGRPIRFEARPFEETFNLLIRKKKAEITYSEDALSSLIRTWRSLPPRAIGTTSSQQFQKLKGLHRICCRVKEMARAAVKEIVIMTSGRELAKLATYGLLEDLQIVQENGVDVTILTEPGYDVIANDNGINLVNCCSIQGDLPYIILVDRAHMLAITEDDVDPKEIIALWTNCSALCEAIHLFFDYEFSH